MEKIKLNNQVVHMRKYVKQAKVHTINKLVKQVKLLQNRKGNEVQVLKAKRKAERFLEEISLIKKKKPDYISKLALSKAKDWKDILLQKNCTIEDRCNAMLANYEPVQKEVEVFLSSNKEIASKISDLINQWEEKNKFNKESPQKKKSGFEKLKNNTKLQNMNLKVTQCQLNLQADVIDGGSIKSSDETTESDLLIDNSHKLEIKQKNKNTIKQHKNFPGPSKNLSEDVSINNNDLQKYEEMDSLENKSKIFINNDDNKSENKSKKDESEPDNDCDVRENESENDDFDMEESESDNDCDVRENDDFDMEESESDDDSKLEDIVENEFEIRSPEIKDSVEFNKANSPQKRFTVSDSKNSNTSCSSSIKIDSIGPKSGENKVKAIAMLNLDDFKDLDEIPVNNSIENDEASEEEKETVEDSSHDASQNDPFFLGRDEAVSIENTLVDDPNKNKYGSINKIFDRKEKLHNQSGLRKKFHKPLNHSHFTESSKTRTFKKDNFVQKNEQNRFQRRNKMFGREDKDNSKGRFQPYKKNTKITNQGEFKKKTYTESYQRNEHKKSNNLHHTNEGKNSLGKSKGPHNKDAADIKPLHPSWEAKRKQKESINTSFQGKRIVFTE